MSVSGPTVAAVQVERLMQPAAITAGAVQEVAQFNAAIVEAKSRIATAMPADIAPAIRESAIGNRVEAVLDRISLFDDANGRVDVALGSSPSADRAAGGNLTLDQTMAAYAEILSVAVEATLIVRGTSQLTTTANQLIRG
jgi:hypothetical protein